MELTLSTPEGDAVEVTPVDMPEDIKAASEAFHRAQANEPLAGEAMRPPKRKPRPAKPEAPEGDAAPRRGRPARAEAARTTTKAKVVKEPLKPKDFTQSLTDATDALWMMTGSTPSVGAQKASILIKANQAQLVGVINAGAQTNRVVRRVAEFVSGGEGSGWLLGAAYIGYGMYQQVQAMNSNPELLAAAIEANTQAIQQTMAQVFGIVQEQTASA